MNKSLSIIIPAYNEEENIKEAIDACLRALPPLVDSFEIIVVNDGSSDKTGRILDELERSEPRLKVYHHPQNLGLGAAIRTGAGHATKDLIFNATGDLQFDIKEIEKFLIPIETADIVLGYKVGTTYNLYRRFNSFANLLLLRVLFGLRVKNANWVKLFRREVFDTIPIRSDGFFWDSELLIKAQKRGFRFAEVPTRLQIRPAGKASGTSPILVFKTFLAMMRFWLTNRS